MSVSTGVWVLIGAVLLCGTVQGGGASTRFSGRRPHADFYVSPQGRDDWSGRLAAPNYAHTDGPFATVARARDAVRALRQKSARPKATLVLLRGGVYRLTEPLTFGPEDSGTAETPIAYAAYPGETPILSGGERLTGWQPVEGGLWKLALPDVKAGRWHFRELFVNGRRAARARLPHTGFYTIADTIPPPSQAPGYTQFRYTPGDLNPAWHNLADVEVVSIHIWSASRLRIAALDEATHTVTFTGSTGWREFWAALAKGNRYYVENVREGLDAPGTWYLDTAEGAVYYHPLPGEDVARAEIVAPRLEQLLHLIGDAAQRRYVTHLIFRGLSFQHTDWPLAPQGYFCPQAEVLQRGSILAEGARDCHFEGCEVAHIGGYAIELGRGCKQNRIAGCRLHDLGAGGVKLGETAIRDSDEEVASDNTVTDCAIFDGGQAHPAGEGIWVGQSPDNLLAHNAIHDFFYTGISLGWTWGYGPSKMQRNRVEYNLIYNIGRGLLSDMGGIYTLGVSPGTRLSHNILHDILSYDYGGWGIYFDEGSSQIVAEDNLVYNTKTGGFHQHYGQDNLVQNNIFALATQAQLQRTRPEDHLSFTFRRNIVYWNRGDLLNGNWQDTAHFHMDDNLYWDASRRPITFEGKSFAEWQRRGEDVHSRIADPLFVAPSRADFTLRPDSPALALGFQAIDLRGVGPRDRAAFNR
ncbi:MAG TPA: right-handed parallel beta-helix repeat-containing protein [Chthonomonadaceae bacterium]|nr:right-handed parallel beta-helix repeat-containing protein [Chthonomonadaceae bacterium]